MSIFTSEKQLEGSMCPTCGVVPCFKVKRVFGKVKKVPITVHGKVHNGVCVACANLQDEMDPSPLSSIPDGKENVSSAYSIKRLVNDIRNGKQALQALRKVRNMSATDSEDDSFQLEFVQQGGLKAVTSVMHSHETNFTIQEQGCAVLRNLSRSNPDPVLDAGGASAVVLAMSSHAEIAIIQQHGCATLRNMANNGKNRSTIGRCGGVQAIINAMHNHPKQVEIQVWACSAICNLCTKNNVNKGVTCEKGGVPALVNAMKLHPKVETVQEKACLALYNLCNSTQAMRLIRQLEPQAMLQDASEAYPDSCKKPAEALLGRL